VSFDESIPISIDRKSMLSQLGLNLTILQNVVDWFLESLPNSLWFGSLIHPPIAVTGMSFYVDNGKLFRADGAGLFTAVFIFV